MQSFAKEEGAMATFLSEQVWLNQEKVKEEEEHVCSSLSSSSLSNSVKGSETEPVLSPEDSFNDPVLQYINEILMQEEKLEDQICMMQECILHHAKLKELSDCIINDSDQKNISFLEEEREFSVLADKYEEEPDMASLQDFPWIQSSGRDMNSHWPLPSRSVDDGNELWQHRGLDDWKELRKQNSSENRWVDELLNMIDEKPQVENNDAHKEVQVHDYSGYPHLQTPPSSSSSLPLSSTTSLSSSSSSSLSSATTSSSFSSLSSSFSLPYHVAKLDPWSPSSCSSLSSSSSTDSHGNRNDIKNGFSMESLAQNMNLDFTGNPDAKKTYISYESRSLTRSVNRNQEAPPMRIISHAHSTSDGGNRYKRAALVLDSISNENLRWPRSVDIATTRDSTMDSNVSVSNQIIVESEVLSYVKNKDLNAEMYANVLNHGLDVIKADLSKIKPPSAPSKGRNNQKLATTADLISLLLSCAQAVSASNARRAQEILKEIRQDSSPYGSDVQRLAHYFAEGLVARLSGTGGQLFTALSSNRPSAAKMLKAHHLFVEICPFVKVSHYFANRAIVKAAKGASRLHIVDYGILYGLQWPGLISALAEREGGPPSLRITGIELPQPQNSSERLEMTGRCLAEYARTYGVPFEFCPIATDWQNVDVRTLQKRPDEILVVNSIFRLRHLFDETVLASNPREVVLKNIFDMRPKIFIQGICNGNYNTPFFMSRFKEALTLFASKFDMLETTISSDNQERMMIEREIMGKAILNIIACEGQERVERPETYRQWQNRVQKAGFVQIALDQSLMRDVPTIVKRKYNKNFSIDQHGCWMLLGWKGKVFHGLSLWKPGNHSIN